MKKVLFMVLMVITVFAVVACGNTTLPTETTEITETTTEVQTTEPESTDTQDTQDTEAPVIEGAEDVTIFLNSVFDPMEGVTATDNVDGDITDQITVAGVVDTTKEGVNFLKYSVTDAAGNKREVNRYVTVEIDPSTIGNDMPQNGDFSLGTAIWTVSENEGGIGAFEVVDGVGTLEIIAAGWSVPFPRLDSSVMEFENGQTYEVVFEAKADAARSIKVQVGQLLPDNPWFVDYLNGYIVIFDLSTEWQTFSFKFTMNEEAEAGVMLEGSLLFNHGTIEGGVGMDNLNTTVYYDNIAIAESTPDPDTTGPTISGAVDLTLETGATFDPLAGVTAVDFVDGNITLDASNYVSDVDTSTPGVYTVTYTVSDAAGNETVLEITVTVVDLVFNNTNEVIDGSFATTTEIIAEVQDELNGYADITDPEVWYHYLATHEGAAATVSVVGEAVVLEVSAPGNNDWGVQLKQRGIALVQGQTYKLTFTASSTVARDMIAKVTDDYFSTVALTTDAQTFSFIFTYENADTLDAKILFLLGNTASYAASTVTIDDVELSVLDQEELVVNGEFNDFGWYSWAQDWDPVAGIDLSVVNGELVADVQALGEAFWSVQIFQEGIPLVPGTEYTITFDAKASVARDMSLVLITDVENRQTFNLTTEMATYTFTFTYNGTATTGKLDFELGDISEASVASVITIDNIAMTDGTDPVEIANSDFEDAVFGWGSYSHAEALAASTMEVVDGQLVMDVTNIGTEFWNVQLFQEGVALIPGETYTVIFNAQSSVARDMSFVLITNVENRETFDLTTEMATYSFTFTYNGTATTGKIDFELGNISASSVPAIITFENIKFFRNLNPQEEPVLPTEEVWTAYGTMTLVEGETDKTITYVAGDANWWDSNVQGALVEFDGTNNAIVFTITGVAGHDYAFKIEGGGVFKEIYHIASGTQETVVIDLSNFTETERNGLNLVVIFSHNTAQAGTLVLHGWAYDNVIPTLTTPFGIVINAGVLQWGAIAEASSFEVYITGYASSPVTVNALDYDLDLTTLGLTTGTYDITIVAIGDGVNYLDSAVSAAVQYTVA